MQDNKECICGKCERECKSLSWSEPLKERVCDKCYYKSMQYTDLMGIGVIWKM